jgi:hypothetical protein
MQLKGWGGRSQLAKLASSIAWLFSLIVLGWVLSSWFWQVFSPESAPHSEVATSSDYQAMANSVVTRHLFGKDSQVDGANHEQTSQDFKLQGAVTGSIWGPGFVILSDGDNGSIPVVVGETVRPGVTLLEIMPGKAKLKINDQVEVLEMKGSAEMQETKDRSGEPGRAPGSSGS